MILFSKIRKYYTGGGTEGIDPPDENPTKLRQKEYDAAKAELDKGYAIKKKTAYDEYRSNLGNDIASKYFDSAYTKDFPVDYSSIELDTSPYPEVNTQSDQAEVPGYNYDKGNWHPQSAAMSRIKGFLAAGEIDKANAVPIGHFDRSKTHSVYSDATHGPGVALGNIKEVTYGNRETVPEVHRKKFSHYYNLK